METHASQAQRLANFFKPHGWFLERLEHRSALGLRMEPMYGTELFMFLEERIDTEVFMSLLSNVDTPRAASFKDTLEENLETRFGLQLRSQDVRVERCASLGMLRHSIVPGYLRWTITAIEFMPSRPAAL